MANYDYVIDCLPLYKAAIEGDWETAKRIFEEENRDINGSISYFSETALHVAVGTNSSHRFVEKLVEMIMEVGTRQMLRTCNCYGTSIIHYAAKVGNTRALRVLVDKDPEIVQFKEAASYTALKLAALRGHRETLCYLLEVTEDVYTDPQISPFYGYNGADLLCHTITAGLYGMCRLVFHNLLLFAKSLFRCRIFIFVGQIN